MTKSWSEKVGKKHILGTENRAWIGDQSGGKDASKWGVVHHLSPPPSSNTETVIQDLKINTKSLLMIQKWRGNIFPLNSTLVWMETI